HLIEEWKCWRKALVGGVPLAVMDFTVPEVVFPENAITLGPIKSGDTESTTFPIRLVGVSDASKLKMAVDISVALPEGLLLFTGIVDGDEPGTKVLSLTVDGREGFRSRRRDTFNGFLKIVPARNSQVVFEKKYIPITIMTKGLVAPPVLVIGAIALVLGACAVGVALAVRTKKSVRPKPHRVIGRLIVIDDPTEGRTGTINLEKISTKSSRLSLVVGRNRTAEVRLKHASVNPDQCTLEAHVVGGRLVTYIEPIGSAKVIVNGKPITSRTPVHDGAKVEIGNFTYQFEDTQLYKRVEVVYRNGRRISGVLDAAGMDAESFRLSPMDAVSPSERARVKFSDIRHVIFHRRTADLLSGAPRSVPKPDTMRRVELMFRKGDTISGYVQREYVEGRRRYITLLPLEPESDIDYTVVDYSAVEDKRNL
ncbi:MAG: FHA domain-containing protein, partial [Candidatus Hydrogenedentota bacterium]